MNDYIKSLENRVQSSREKNTVYKRYTENDCFTFNGEAQFSILDLWRYAYSQLNNIKEQIAEFIVARALGIEIAENVNYWTAYDMSYRNKRIEVKASSYVHPWNETKVSNVRTFSIEPSKNEYWLGSEKTKDMGKYSRQSEVYVFCLNTDKNTKEPNPLNIDFWEFYVVPTFRINKYTILNNKPMQKKISLNVVKKLSYGAVDYAGLKSKIDAAIDESDAYYEENAPY